MLATWISFMNELARRGARLQAYDPVAMPQALDGVPGNSVRQLTPT